MKIKIIFIFTFLIIYSNSLFSQEKYGYIKSAFSFGLGIYEIMEEKKILNTVGVDIDFVSNYGFTLGIKNIFAVNWENFEQALYIPAIGIGYTYDDKRIYTDRGHRSPSFSIKLADGPYMNKPTIGFTINIVEWLSENAGISASVDAHFMKDTNYAWLLFCIGFTMMF
jgi:hypothetical protein